VALAGDVHTIGVEMLSDELRGGPVEAAPIDDEPQDLPLNDAVDALKRRLIQQAVTQTGSKTRAAEKLGIPRQSLQKMMKRLAMND
jgi:transcriptional regulator with PAS, ATPase and Fis domain